MAIPLHAITKFEVNRGSNSGDRGARNGALIGAGIGLFAGGLIGAATFRCEESQNCDPFGETGWVDGFVLGSFILGLPGTVIGFASGLVVGNRIADEQWELMPLPITIDFSPHGMRYVSIRFKFGRK